MGGLEFLVDFLMGSSIPDVVQLYSLSIDI